MRHIQMFYTPNLNLFTLDERSPSIGASVVMELGEHMRGVVDFGSYLVD